MKSSFRMVAVLAALMAAGCATTAAQEQRNAEQHQLNSDAAAKKGQYGVAGDEQRQAQESQNKAIMKGIDEGKAVTPVPPAPATAAQVR